MYKKVTLYCLITILIAIVSCDKAEKPEISEFIYSGEIISTNGESIYPVYIIESNKLINIISENNLFSIELALGKHEILFSAIGYNDNIVSLDLSSDLNTEIIFEASSEIGRVYGEFQDSVFFQQKISENNEIASWNALQVFDGVTGATIQEDNSSTDFEQAQLFIGDSLLRYADVYGQYWIEMQCGTYPITGKNAGYIDKTTVIKVEPDSKVYYNFFMVEE